MTTPDPCPCGRRPFRRGLCSRCYRNTPHRPHRPAADLAEDVEWLLTVGETHPDTIAKRLGYRRSGLWTALRRAHWEAMTAIRGTWYGGATPEEIAQLDAEWDRHIDADQRLRVTVKAAVLALLPLAIDEPADLIEWAAATEAGGAA